MFKPFNFEKAPENATKQEKIEIAVRNNMRFYGMPEKMARELVKMQIEGKEKCPWN